MQKPHLLRKIPLDVVFVLRIRKPYLSLKKALNVVFAPYEVLCYNSSNPAGDSISSPTPTDEVGCPLIRGLCMERVIAYVDGFNLYYGLRSKGWKRFYWLNIQKLAQQFIKSNQALIQTKYFTTIVKRPDDKRRRQAVFLDALKLLPDFDIFYGQFLSEEIVCRVCGHTYTTYHEKMTDVNISVELMTDALQNRFDVALLISADSDLVGPVETVQRLFPTKRVVAIFPPGRSSFALKQIAKAVLHIGHIDLARSLFPDEISRPDGVSLRRPTKWH